MKSVSLRRLGLVRLAVVALLVASSAHSAVRPASQRATPAPGVHLVAFGSRSPAQWHSATLGKLDGALADLTRHTYRVRAGHALEDLHSLSPAARFAQARDNSEPLVLVDAVTRGDPQRLLAALLSLGLEHPSVYSNDVSGWLPVRQIEAAAARAEVHALRAAMPQTRAGAVTSQGDFVQGSATLRATWPTLDGSGVTVGVLSDSFNCYHVYATPGSGVPASGPNGYASNGFTADAVKDESTGDLPATVTVLEEAGQIINQTCLDYGKPQQLPYADEGRAMLQIVHDVAPGASLAFHTAVEGEADFANGITALAASGAKVIADDVGYFDEPFFQDGITAQAIDRVEAQGVAYFSAAGNSGQLGYDNLAPHFNTPSTSPAGEMLLNFDTSNMTTATALPITIGSAANNTGLVPGEFVAVVVEWDQPYVTGAPASPGASSRIDVCVTVASGTDTIINGITGSPVVTCTGPNSTGVDPLQILIIGNPANATGNTGPETLNLVVGLVNGSPMPGRIKIAVDDNGAGSTINAFDTQGGTLHGHPGAAGAMAVGAAFFFQTPACGTSPAVVEPFSSKGGDPILFDTSGIRLGSPQYRQKPDIVGPDGTNNTFLGFVAGATGGGLIECQNNSSFPSFFGTSAATPHLAGVAALMLHANSAVTPTLIYGALKTSAAPMGGAPPMQVGAGFVQAGAALALLPPAAPTISLSPTSITVGMSSTLTWSGINVTGCAASGSWSGAQVASGTQTVTPMAAGNLTYTLTCSNGAGSAKSAAMLAVQAAPMSSGGGGGGLDAAALLALAGLACARLVRAGRRGSPLACAQRP
jgi:hypothetical protein